MKISQVFLFSMLVLLCTKSVSQDLLHIHNNGSIIYTQQVSSIDSLKLRQRTSSVYSGNNLYELPITDIDSITFAVQRDSEIYIIYNESEVTVINPFEAAGVTITNSAGHVTVNSSYPSAGLAYHISGITADGSLDLSSTEQVKLILYGVNITNTTGAAISINNQTNCAIVLASGTESTLNDAVTSVANGAFYSTGDVTISGEGTLKINGYKKHGIATDGAFDIISGIIEILNAASDGIHADSYHQAGGSLQIVPLGDGIDVSKMITIEAGTLMINAASKDIKGLKASSVIISGGTIDITVSGEQAKAIKSSENITISGGEINIVASGTIVLVASGSGYDPSYCTGIKSDADVLIQGGSLTIDCPASNAGGKGISADGDIFIEGGDVNITTAGNGAKYTNTAGTADSYTAACIKSDKNISLISGNISCTSSGTGGKGISADSAMLIGSLLGEDELLLLNVTTTGARFLVSGSGQNADYANPKAIKAEGTLTINSGIINVNTTTEGGEGLESKAKLYINGGQITANTYDDGINAASHIEVSGGKHALKASNNDGMDSNGTLTVSGGMVISKGAGGPEEGFDCDNNTFKITGGIIVGVGGNTSNPTVAVSTQNALKLSITSNQNICIKNAANEIVLIYAIPSITGGGGPGGGGNKAVVLFSDPAFTNGSYTIFYGGTISGGTAFNGYYSGATYSGGSSQTFNVSSILTTLSI